MVTVVSAADIDARLEPLLGEVTVAARDDARLVVSSAGLFVLSGDVGGAEGAADGATDLARATRASLAETVIPTPMVHPVVVTRVRDNRHEAVSCFLYMLDDLLTAGRALDDTTLQQIRDLVDAGGLAPGWRTAVLV